MDINKESNCGDEEDGSISPIFKASVAQISALFDKKALAIDRVSKPKLTKRSPPKPARASEKQAHFNHEDTDKSSDGPPSVLLDDDVFESEIISKPVKPPRKKQFKIYQPVEKLLLAATTEGNLDVVTWLLQHNIDPNEKDKNGRTSLLIAACFDKLGIFRYLLKVSDVNQTDCNGWNALHIGVIAGHLRIVKECINFISLNSRSASGLTALCLAANKGHLYIVEYLLKKGADVENADKHGWTSLHFAAQGRYDLILYVLLNSGKCTDLLNAKTTEGMTPLALAVRYNSLECVRYLLDSGADPNIKDNKGWSPARHAAINNFQDIGQYLASYKAVL